MMSLTDFQKNPLTDVRKIDCALLPPTRRTLKMKVRRAQYVATLWSHAMLPFPSVGLSPTDYGWKVHDNILKPIWFEGPAIPDNLFVMDESDRKDIGADSDLDLGLQPIDGVNSDSDEAWSEDSESENED